ncbi:hypothetical protein AAE478_004074 [Parahypoxylon ruwenzoriense]
MGALSAGAIWAPNEAKYSPFDTHEYPDKLRETAKEQLSQTGWYYTSCNAGLPWTHYADRQAFFRHQIIPRTLVSTTGRETATTIFGRGASAPFGFAPIGINRIYHSLGELAPARVAGELGLSCCLSSAGSCSIEDVASANDDGAGGDKGGSRSGVRYYQLYWSPDDEVTLSMLRRACDNGFGACFVTTDTWQLGWCHDDVARGNYAFHHEHGVGDLGLSDPALIK